MFAKSAIVQSGRQRVLMVHSVFSVLCLLQQKENIVMFDGQSDVDTAGLHENETFNIWRMFTRMDEAIWVAVEREKPGVLD